MKKGEIKEAIVQELNLPEFAFNKLDNNGFYFIRKDKDGISRIRLSVGKHGLGFHVFFDRSFDQVERIFYDFWHTERDFLHRSTFNFDFFDQRLVDLRESYGPDILDDHIEVVCEIIKEKGIPKLNNIDSLKKVLDEAESIPNLLERGSYFPCADIKLLIIRALLKSSDFLDNADEVIGFYKKLSEKYPNAEDRLDDFKKINNLFKHLENIYNGNTN